MTVYRDELYHWGIKGMKLGVRRYPQQLLRLYHPQSAGQAHQFGVHRNDCRQDAAG